MSTRKISGAIPWRGSAARKVLLGDLEGGVLSLYEDELSAEEWSQLSGDIRTAELALIKAFNPDHINIASIGQVVPHLHWHIIPRYVDDPRWGGPIWMTDDAEMQKHYLQQNEYNDLTSRITAALDATD